MHDYNIVHCVDLSREDLEVESDMVYTRVFGGGQHTIYRFIDEELVEVESKITDKDPDTASVSFHNVRMYKDAARFKICEETGGFSSVTGVEGQQSLRKVLLEDARFPTSKSDLLREQG